MWRNRERSSYALRDAEATERRAELRVGEGGRAGYLSHGSGPPSTISNTSGHRPRLDRCLWISYSAGGSEPDARPELCLPAGAQVVAIERARKRRRGDRREVQCFLPGRRIDPAVANRD